MEPTREMQFAIGRAVAELSMLRYFPSDEFARAGLMRQIDAMAETPGQVRELVRRILAHYNDWPGPRELCGVFCTFARPRDGIEAGVTGAFAAEIEQRALEEHAGWKELPPAAGALTRRLMKGG